MSPHLQVLVSPRSLHDSVSSPNCPNHQVLIPPAALGSGDLRTRLDGFLDYLSGFRGCSPLTIAAYRRDAEDFIAFLEDQGLFRVAEVGRLHAHRYAAAVPSRGKHVRYSPASIRRKLFSLSSWFPHLNEVGLVQGNPFADITLPKREHRLVRVPDEEQCQALLSAARSAKESVPMPRWGHHLE
jgi:site-specific recombinase XerD